MRIDLLVSNFVYRAVNDRFVVLFEEAHFNRNYIHISRRWARLHAACWTAKKRRMAVQPNVGLSDANEKKAELCERIQNHQIPAWGNGKAPVGKVPDSPGYIVSGARIERPLIYMPAHGLDDGISELIKGFHMIRDRAYGNI